MSPRIMLGALALVVLAGCTSDVPDDVTGTWTLTGRVANPTAAFSCSISGTLELAGTLRGFHGTAEWTMRIVRNGVVEVTPHSHTVRGWNGIEFFSPGNTYAGTLVGRGSTSELMWGPWTCGDASLSPPVELHGNWFLRKERGGLAD